MNITEPNAPFSSGTIQMQLFQEKWVSNAIIPREMSIYIAAISDEVINVLSQYKLSTHLTNEIISKWNENIVESVESNVMSSEMRTAESQMRLFHWNTFNTNLPFQMKCNISWVKWTHFR